MLVSNIIRVGWSKTAIFGAFGRYFSELLEIRPKLLYGNMLSLADFSLTSMNMILNDLKWPFYVKFFFQSGMSSTPILWLLQTTGLI